MFVTAYNQFAIRAFEVDAVDYLLKPISKEKLIDAVEKASQRNPVTNSVIKSIIDAINTNTTKHLPHIALPTPEGLGEKFTH